jgi:hypothetical protein
LRAVGERGVGKGVGVVLHQALTSGAFDQGAVQQAAAGDYPVFPWPAHRK